MDSEEIVSLYTWQRGTCFRHPNRGEISTTQIKTLHPRSGPAQALYVCRPCLLAIEAARYRRAERAGQPYEPGHAGE